MSASVPSGQLTILRPTIDAGETRRFMANVALSWEQGALVATDVRGRRHPLPTARTVVLQHDLVVGVRQLHGSHDMLLVLNGDERVLAHASRRPFDVGRVDTFCRAHGLEPRSTSRDRDQPCLPPKAPGYRSLTVPRQTAWMAAVPPCLSLVVGVAGPWAFVYVVAVGSAVGLALLMGLT